MADDQEENHEEVPPVVDAEPSDEIKDPVVLALIEKQVAASVKDFKQKVDKAYTDRDVLQAKVAEFEKAAREAELERLKTEGKHKEAYELQLEELRTQNAQLAKQNVELTRDLKLNSSLSAFPFRNKSAQEMAFKEIASSLVRNESNEWVHKTGVSIETFVKAFAEHEDNGFLFKPKVSRGSGQQENQQNQNQPDGKPKSVFDLTPEELADRAAKGTLRRKRN